MGAIGDIGGKGAGAPAGVDANGGGAVGANAGFGSAGRIAEPHILQKFIPGGFWAPQAGHSPVGNPAAGVGGLTRVSGIPASAPRR
jgi:hypothetical protein